jgi:ubiquinone biosynthesis protein COQ4
VFNHHRSSRIKPIAAIAAIHGLMRDPQDTGQVFRLTEALRGRSTRVMFKRFAAVPMGARILREQRSLLATLSDHAALAALPPNSLGRRYLDFMTAEKLSAQGLVELASRNLRQLPGSDDAIRLYAARMRDMHDLYHVLTGYGRDELGEVCVLAFSYPQQRIRSFRVISALGTLNLWRVLRRAGVKAGGLFAVVREASRHGRQAAWLPGEDIEAMLGEDLDLLRARLNIAPPRRYREFLARLATRHGPLHGDFREWARRVMELRNRL